MSEEIRKIVVGGMIGEEGVVAMVGNDLPFPEAEVKKRLDHVQFMEQVGCLNCVAMSEMMTTPSLDIQSVLGHKDRTLITAVCPGAVQIIKEKRQLELKCHVPQKIELVFERE